MDTSPHTLSGDAKATGESPDQRKHRLAHEAVMIDEAMADWAAGRVVSAEAVDAWIDSIGTDRERNPQIYADFPDRVGGHRCLNLCKSASSADSFPSLSFARPGAVSDFTESLAAAKPAHCLR